MQKITDAELMLAVISGDSQKSIAQRFGMAESSISKRIHTSRFQNMLCQYRSQMIDNTLSSLSKYAIQAVETLGELLNSDNEWMRLQASTKILDYVQSYSYQNDILRQLKELKEYQEEQNELWQR